MLSRIAVVLLALCLLGMSTQRTASGFIPVLSFLAAAVVWLHVNRRRRSL